MAFNSMLLFFLVWFQKSSDTWTIDYLVIQRYSFLLTINRHCLILYSDEFQKTQIFYNVKYILKLVYFLSIFKITHQQQKQHIYRVRRHLSVRVLAKTACNN